MVATTTASQFGTIEAYMAEFASEMGARTEAGLAPHFDPAREQLSQDVQDLFVNPLGFHAPKPAQAVAVEACLRELAVKRVADLNGEQGSGKTPMGLWVARLMASRGILTPHRKRSGKAKFIRVIVTCPNQLVKKWANHADRIIPNCRARIVNSYQDLLPLVGNPKPVCNEVWVIPRDKGKLSYAWRPGVNVHTRPVWIETPEGPMRIEADLFHCPACGEIIKHEVKGERVPVGLAYFANSKGGPGSRRKCPCCHEQLWQAFNGNPDTFRPSLPAPGMNPRRCAPAEFIWRRNLRFDLYIADEVHELQNESLQGATFAWLSARSTKTICATGTVTGGYASNLLHTLWRTEPSRMRADGLTYDEDGHASFVKKYGVLQTRKKYVAKDAGQGIKDLLLGRGRCKSNTVKVLPGISPQLYTRMLMPRSVFVRLLEMEDSLPEFAECVQTVPLTLEAALALETMTEQFTKHAEKMKASHEPCRAWSAARACFLRWSDRPWPAYDIWDRDREGNKILAVSVPALSEDTEYPKELRLRRLILAERMRGLRQNGKPRKCCVFTEMTGPVWDVTGRLVKYLEKHGIKCAVLNTQASGGPKPEDRDEWITEAMEDADVLLCNPNLVKTGLDLLSTPTIIFYYTGYSLYTLRQASRRAWRLGQTRACKVYYLCYAGTKLEDRKVSSFCSLQSACMSLMAAKLTASLALEGDFSSEGLAAMSESEDMASKLAKVIAGKLQTEDPKVAYAKYREQLAKIVRPVSMVKMPVVEPAAVVSDAPPERTGQVQPQVGVNTHGSDGDGCATQHAALRPADASPGIKDNQAKRAESRPGTGGASEAIVTETPKEKVSKNGGGTFDLETFKKPGAPLVKPAAEVAKAVTKVPVKPAAVVKNSTSDLRAAMGRLTQLLWAEPAGKGE